MKRLRRWAIPVLLAFLMFSCAGCGDSAPVTEDEGGTPPSGSVSAESTPVYSFPSEKEEQSAGYKLGRIYKTMEELFEAADSIIIGEVCYQEFYQYEEQRSSYAQVWVEETLYGDQQPQKMLTVCEVGAKFGNGTEGSILQIPLLRKGQRVLLFLFENARLVPPWNNGCAIVGEYQGKFFYNQAENAWYHSGTLGTYADVPEGMRDPISDADMRRLIDSMANQ